MPRCSTRITSPNFRSGSNHSALPAKEPIPEAPGPPAMKNIGTPAGRPVPGSRPKVTLICLLRGSLRFSGTDSSPHSPGTRRRPFRTKKCLLTESPSASRETRPGVADVPTETTASRAHRAKAPRIREVLAVSWAGRALTTAPMRTRCSSSLSVYVSIYLSMETVVARDRGHNLWTRSHSTASAKASRPGRGE